MAVATLVVERIMKQNYTPNALCGQTQMTTASSDSACKNASSRLPDKTATVVASINTISDLQSEMYSLTLYKFTAYLNLLHLKGLFRKSLRKSFSHTHKLVVYFRVAY